MPAQRYIKLKDGVAYSKCYIPPAQWEECLTPCSYCALQVQKECDQSNPFCRNEHVCFIDLNKVDE